MPLVAFTVLTSGELAAATTSDQSVSIACKVQDGSGNTRSDTAAGSNASQKAQFKSWVLSGDGVDIGDTIRLYWHRKPGAPARLRVAVDGPVSKPAHILSMTDDTVVALTLTSDQDTTRAWQFAINFRREEVAAAGLASNPYRLSGQLIVLECAFEARANADTPMADAADHWKQGD